MACYCWDCYSFYSFYNSVFNSIKEIADWIRMELYQLYDQKWKQFCMRKL